MKITVNDFFNYALGVAIDEAIVWRIFEVFRLMNRAVMSTAIHSPVHSPVHNRLPSRGLVLTQIIVELLAIRGTRELHTGTRSDF